MTKTSEWHGFERHDYGKPAWTPEDAGLWKGAGRRMSANGVPSWSDKSTIDPEQRLSPTAPSEPADTDELTTPRLRDVSCRRGGSMANKAVMERSAMSGKSKEYLVDECAITYAQAGGGYQSQSYTYDPYLDDLSNTLRFDSRAEALAHVEALRDEWIREEAWHVTEVPGGLDRLDLCGAVVTELTFGDDGLIVNDKPVVAVEGIPEYVRQALKTTEEKFAAYKHFELDAMPSLAEEIEAARLEPVAEMVR